MPTIVGETDAGEPIYEAQGVRLLLRGDASHFNRIVACSKCQQDVPGRPVLSPGDLDHAPHAVICKECVRSATPAYAPERAIVRTPPLPATAAARTPDPVQNGHSPTHADIVVLERRLGELAGLMRAQGTELKAELDVRARNIQTELRRDLEGAVARLERVADVDRDPAEGLERRIEALEAAAKDDVAGLRAQVAAGHESLRGAQQELGGRVDRISGLLADGNGPDLERLQAIEEQLSRLQLVVEAEVVRAAAEPAAGVQGSSDVRKVEQQLDERLNRLAEQAQHAEADRQAFEQQVEETIERRAAGVEAQQSELRTAVEANVEQLGAIRRDADQAEADVARVVLANEQLNRSQETLVQRLDSLAEHVHELHASVEAGSARIEDRDRAQDDLSRRLDEVVELVQRLQVGVDSGAARAQSDSATVAKVNVDLVSIEKQLTQRLDRLAERAVRTDDVMSELGEYHAALDVGLGALRSEIAEVRSAVTRVAGDHADIQDRIEDLSRAPRAAPPADQGRGRKAGRKAESGAHLAVAIEATELLAREHQQLKAQVLRLEHELDAATARAASQASAASPLRSDIRLLQEQLAAQNEAMATLSLAVERLRRKVSTPGAATKPARKATKG